MLLTLVAALLCVSTLQAFELSHYTEQSVLATGKWVKIGVKESGLYKISSSTLQSWGFSDASKVRIHGYGGNRINDVLSTANYIDDLPQVASEAVADGVVFYAVGPDQWDYTYNNAYYYHKEFSPYTSMGYYFVTEVADAAAIEIPSIGTPGVAGITEVKSEVQARIHLEQDLVQATEAGPLLVGEDFKSTPSRQFTIETPGRVAGSDVLMECQMVARLVGSASTMSFTVEEVAEPFVATDRISATSESGYIHASVGVTRHKIKPTGDASFKLGVKISSSANIEKANLDYLSFAYTRRLEIPASGMLNFWSNSRGLKAANAASDLRIWDVTVPANISKVNFENNGGSAEWGVTYSGYRNYVAWTPSASIPAPEYVGKVDNQNLHAPGEAVDMVIFTTPKLAEQAKRIADLHEANDSLKVAIVDANKVYNEFSSGAADVSGLRKYLKMVYDRGNEAGKPLRFALLLGRTTLDHRNILQSTKNLDYTTMPAWVVRGARLSMTDNDGFSTDDFTAMLEDNSGTALGFDKLSVALVRIPMTSAYDGKEIVDKLYHYVYTSKRSHWKNRIMVLADDEDLGVHLRQTESLVSNILATTDQQHLIEKVYLDAYLRSSGQYPEARRDMFTALEEGVTWWFFAGHANNHSWTGEGQLTYKDINSMYLRNLPFLVAATCDFLRWDSETTSGGEIMYKERYGGVIGMISATRPVYISDNGYFAAALGRAMVSRRDGRLLTAGEVYQTTKNNILNGKGDHVSNTNRLRFVFMGDPAMRISAPDNIVEVLTINGKEVTPDAQITIAAMSNAVITGRVVSPDRKLLSDFNGTVTVEIFDALKSITTHANGEEGQEEVFDTQGDKLFIGAATVKNGEFTLTAAMPSMIAENFRPATMMLYAEATNSNAEAIGANRDFYVFGFEEPAAADTEAPVISMMALNHADFRSGDIVNSAPLLIAQVSDNVGLNLSQTGIGQQMTATIDGNKSYNDVALYYTPSDDPNVIGGTINYAFENLTEGVHTLRLRVFDTSGNVAEQTIEFYVDLSQQPQIFDVHTDANPASTEANFYVTHDRPESIVEVRVEVFDMLGRPLWEGASKGMSDMNISAPVTWNLTDSTGRRVPRGIYLYRASIATDSADYKTESRRIAVTAR